MYVCTQCEMYFGLKSVRNGVLRQDKGLQIGGVVNDVWTARHASCVGAEGLAYGDERA